MTDCRVYQPTCRGTAEVWDARAGGDAGSAEDDDVAEPPRRQPGHQLGLGEAAAARAGTHHSLKLTSSQPTYLAANLPTNQPNCFAILY